MKRSSAHAGRLLNTASRRKTASGPETHDTEPKDASAALATLNWPSCQTSCTRAGRPESVLSARQWSLKTPSSGWVTSARTQRRSASGASTQSESVKAMISVSASAQARTRACFLLGRERHVDVLAGPQLRAARGVTRRSRVVPT